MTRLTSSTALRVEGAVIILLALGMIGQNLYFAGVAEDSRACITANFTELADVLEYRSELAARETRAGQQVNLAELTATSDRAYANALREYRDTIATIQRQRDRNPVPAYPAGVCNP